MELRSFHTLKRSNWFKLLAWLGYLNVIDAAAAMFPVRLERKNRKRVVFARLDGLGDYILWAETLDGLEGKYPSSEYERILILDERWKGIADAEETFERRVYLNVERLIGSSAYRFRMIRTIRALNPDVFINPKLTRDFILVDPLVKWSGARERIGCAGRDNRMSRLQDKITRRWYTKLTPAPKVSHHELESNLDFMRSLHPGRTVASELRVENATQPKSDPGEKIMPDYALLFVGTAAAEKSWPIEKFGKAASYIASKYGLRIVLSGGERERAYVKDFGAAFGKEFVDMVGKTTLPSLADLARGASLVLTNDTGLAHIATISKIPTIVITPGNHVGRFFPYPKELEQIGIKQRSVIHKMSCFGCGWHCVHKLAAGQPLPCVEGVRVDDVILAIEDLVGHPERVLNREHVGV